MKKKILATCLALAAVIAGFIIFDIIRVNQTYFNGSRTANPDLYQLDFSYYNADDSCILVLEKGDILSVDADISKGRVSLQIASDGEESIYRSNSLENGHFEVTVPVSGNYKVITTGKKASGKLEIRLKD